MLLTNGLDEGILMAVLYRSYFPHEGAYHDARDHRPHAGIRIVSEFDDGSPRVRPRFSVPANPDLSFPTDAVIAAITPRTRMIFLNTPNNPTGQLIPVRT